MLNVRTKFNDKAVLYDETRKKLEQVFGVPIMQIYQSSEGSMAMPCKHASLHINEDLMHIDLRDKNGDVTLPGEISHQMIVTDLHKRSQPIIRFELNDAITISPETCSCGSQFRVIDQIWGRNDDMYYGLSSKTKEPQFILRLAKPVTRVGTDETPRRVARRDELGP